MEQFLETFILLINITIHEDSPIKICIIQYIMDNHWYKLLMYFVLVMADFFYLNKDGKLDLHVLVGKETPCSKNKFIDYIHFSAFNENNRSTCF